MLRRLRVKFVCINMLLVTIMLAVMFGMVMHSTKADLERQSIQMMHAVAANPMHVERPGAPDHEVRLPYFTLQMGPQGDVLSKGGGYYDLSDQNFLEDLIQSSYHSGERTGVLKDYSLRFVRIHTPRGELMVFSDISSENETMNGLLRSCLLIGGLSFVAFLIISIFLARWAVKPVEQAWEQQKQFVADASHELKTPLTVITTNAELLQSLPLGSEREDQCIGHILAMAGQMRGLVESLLELARVDSGAVPVSHGAVDLSRLTEEMGLLFDALFFEHGLMFSSSIQENIWIKGCPSQLKQVIEILLDNAIKYSDEGGSVSLELKLVRRGAALLSVSNNGTPLSKEDLSNVFKRFYRLDAVREINHSYGLGLSIAQSIVQSHRGKIWAESNRGQNTFFVQFPITQR